MALPRPKGQEMGKVIVMNGVTLDGVMQSPGRADEDTRDGFEHGGWAVPYGDEAMVAKMGERMGEDRAWLFGRRTYEDAAGSLERAGRPVQGRAQRHSEVRRLERPGDEARMAELDAADGDVPAAVAELKQSLAANLVIMGSGVLIGSLMAADLVDEYLLTIAPLVLGTGRRLFAGGTHAALRLVESSPTSTGVLMAIYEPARG